MKAFLRYVEIDGGVYQLTDAFYELDKAEQDAILGDGNLEELS